MARSALAFLLAAALFACAESSSPAPDVQAGDADATVTDAEELTEAEATGPDTEDPAPAETGDDGDSEIGDLPHPEGARAFVSTSKDQLIGGPMAVGVPGDLVIENSRVRFVIRHGRRSLYSPYEGALVDADVARPAGQPGNDQFFEMFPMIGVGRVFRPTKMEIVDPGETSGTAVVRFTGTDGGMSIIDSLLASTSAGLEATTEYRLEGDARHLEIVTTIRNASGTAATATAGLVTQLGKRLVKFHDGCGTDQSCLSTAAGTRFVAGAAGDVSYALTPPSPDTVSMLLAVEELMILGTGTFDLDDGAEATVRQYLVVGNGTVEDAVDGVKALRGEAAGTPVELAVTLGDAQSSMADALVRVRKAGAGSGGWVTSTRPASDGKAVVHLAPGDYDFVTSVPGAPDATKAGVHVGDAAGDPVALAASQSGRLRVVARDKAGTPVTAALTLQAGHGAAMPAGTLLYESIHGGDRTIPVVPGEYTANVAHGLLWTLDREDVTVPAGGVATIEATIDPISDTAGYRMLNTHEHTEWSPDSAVAVEDRVWNALANGIDLMNSTDHDHFGARQGTIEAMGVADRVRGIPGCEVSPMWGHTTAAGCRNPPPYETYYSVDFVEYDATGTMVRLMSASEIFTQARSEFQCDFLAVNHPYRSEGMFVQYGVDGVKDPALAEPGLDLHLVDGMEIYNKSDTVDSILANSMPAWFNLLNRGYAIAVIGGSDEHDFAGSYGSPRNMVPVTAGLADAGLQAEVFASIKAYRSIVVGGPLIRLAVDGAGLGETVTAAGGTVKVHVQVLAPPWMQIEFARVYANGQIVKDVAVPALTDVTRVDETFDLPLLTDAHVVAAAGSTQSAHEMLPVSPRAPFSITNPIFVDADGGGYEPIWKDGAPQDAL